jgi:hypothetical protein
VAPLAFALGMGLLIHHTCQGAERTRATIVLDFGEAAAKVDRVDAQLVVAGDVIGTFHRKALPGMKLGEAKFEVSMPEPEGTLQVDVALGETERRLVRKVRAEEGATVFVRLGDDLRDP